MRHRLGVGDVQAFLGDAWDRVEALKGAHRPFACWTDCVLPMVSALPSSSRKDGDHPVHIFRV
jgi:hypothetical protein